jgi:hypothetical protein
MTGCSARSLTGEGIVDGKPVGDHGEGAGGCRVPWTWTPSRAACRAVLAEAADPRYAHTSHLHVRVAGQVVVDEHLRGPRRVTSSR